VELHDNPDRVREGTRGLSTANIGLTRRPRQRGDHALHLGAVGDRQGRAYAPGSPRGQGVTRRCAGVVGQHGHRARHRSQRAPHAAAERVFPDWDVAADDAVSLLRAEAARSPDSPVVTGLVGELATRSEEFRSRWAAHNVKAHRHGVKRFQHADVGELSLTYNVFDITGVGGLSLIGYTAEPQSRSEEALRLLASWTASAGPARVRD
jgi:MmyB-like transcription regulator ligand binding domain